MVETSKPMEMYIILFDDMLLITRRKKALSKKVVHTFIFSRNEGFVYFERVYWSFINIGLQSIPTTQPL